MQIKQLSPINLAALAGLLSVSLVSAVSEGAIAHMGRPLITAFGASQAENPVQLTQAATVGDIVDVASGNEDFSTLVQAVQAADLVDTLRGDGPFTVFAPTNAAFNDLPEGALNALLRPENQDLLTELISYHVVLDEVTSDELATGTVDTLNGGASVNVSPGRIVINDASVVQADVPASNGVIHVVNRVLVPEGLLEELQARTAIRGLW